MRIYIAGPMTGIDELNFPAFHAAAARLRALGHEVVNPAEINPDPGASWQTCMHADLAQLVTCDAIALLPGWEGSRGAELERHVAYALGMHVHMLHTVPSAEEVQA
jgi:hypothetical protein